MEKNAHQTMGVQHFFQKGALFLFQKYIKPRSTQEDDRRHEFILNILLLCSIALSFACLVIILLDTWRLGGAYSGVPWWMVAIIFLIFSTLLFASRQGYFSLSSYILIALYLLPVLYMTLVWGLDLPQGLLTYALLIIMTSVLISTRFSLAFTAALSIFLASLDILYQAELWRPDQSWRSAPFVPLDGVAFTVTFAAIAAVSWLSNREIEKSLTRARASEAALKAERDLLEVKVEERTRELRLAQNEKIAQLQRFVEFGRLASGLFHDLASPLTAVALNLESLNNAQAPDATRAKQHLAQAIKATKGLENFLAAARKQLQRQEAQSNFDVSQATTQVIEILSHRAKKAGVDINATIPKNIVLFGNPLKFHQIISNLLSNAIDSYSGLASPHQPIHLIITSQGDHLKIDVQDHGCGMTPDIQRHVFEPFFTTKDMSQGMGIGLSSTRNIVENDYHGTISFTSHVAQGTTFTIRLPLDYRQAATGVLPQ